MQIRLLVACQGAHAAGALYARLASADRNIVGKATVLAHVLGDVASFRPDVVIVEMLAAREDEALDTISSLRRPGCATRVMLLADAPAHEVLHAAIERGAAGCILRASPPALQAKAVRVVRDGETWFARAELVAILRTCLTPPASPMDGNPGQHPTLTAREREILKLIGNAMSNKEIARHLDISEQTVKTHLHHIYLKLHRSGRFKALLSNGQAAPPWAALAR